MSQPLRKRGREPDSLPACTDVWEAKRFHGEETDWFCHLQELDHKTVAQEEEICAPSEEIVSGVMRSLEEDIAAACFTSNLSPNSGDYSASSGISSGQQEETLDPDMGANPFYLLDASDDKLGIPLSPVLDLKNEIWQSLKETSKGLLENPDLKSLGEIWQFEDDVESYQQIALYEDTCEASKLQDYMNGDFLSKDMFLECDISTAWTLETAGCL